MEAKDNRWIAIPNKEFALNGILQLGQILQEPYEPSTCLFIIRNAPSLPPKMKIDESYREDWTKQSQSRKEVRFDTHCIIPPKGYIEEVLLYEEVQEYISQIRSFNDEREIVYMITGLKVAREKESKISALIAVEAGDFNTTSKPYICAYRLDVIWVFPPIHSKPFFPEESVKKGRLKSMMTRAKSRFRSKESGTKDKTDLEFPCRVTGPDYESNIENGRQDASMEGLTPEAHALRQSHDTSPEIETRNGLGTDITSDDLEAELEQEIDFPVRGQARQLVEGDTTTGRSLSEYGHAVRPSTYHGNKSVEFARTSLCNPDVGCESRSMETSVSSIPQGSFTARSNVKSGNSITVDGDDGSTSKEQEVVVTLAQQHDSSTGRKVAPETFLHSQPILPNLEGRNEPSIATVSEDESSTSDNMSDSETSMWPDKIFDSATLVSVNDSLNAEKGADRWFNRMNQDTQRFFFPLRKDLHLSKMVKVAIIDSGLDLDHPLLATYRATGQVNPTQCIDFIQGMSPITDSTGHGTHCTHLILKTAPNCRIFMAKVFDKSKVDQSTIPLIAKAIRWAVDDCNVDIISMAFSFSYDHEEIRTAINYAYTKRKIMFAAAGNNYHNNRDPVGFPARLEGREGIIRINSCTWQGRRSDFSPEGTGGLCNFAVIGEMLNAAFPQATKYKNNGKQLKRENGTSCATAIAAGISALIMEYAKLDNVPPIWSEFRDRLTHVDGMKNVMLEMTGDQQQTSTGYNFFTDLSGFDEDMVLLNYLNKQ